MAVSLWPGRGSPDSAARPLASLGLAVPHRWSAAGRDLDDVVARQPYERPLHEVAARWWEEVAQNRHGRNAVSCQMGDHRGEFLGSGWIDAAVVGEGGAEAGACRGLAHAGSQGDEVAVREMARRIAGEEGEGGRRIGIDPRLARLGEGSQPRGLFPPERLILRNDGRPIEDPPAAHPRLL